PLRLSLSSGCSFLHRPSSGLEMRLKPLEVEAEGQGRIPPRDKRDLRVNRVNRGAGNGNRTRIPSLEGWSSTIELSPHAFGESTKSTMSTRATGSPDSSGSCQSDLEDPVDLEDLVDLLDLILFSLAPLWGERVRV